MISVELLKDRSAIEAISDEWDLLAGNSCTSIFARPGWYLAWLDAYPVSRIVVITARDGNRLIGVLPMACTRSDARGLYFSRVAPLAPGLTDYQALIVDPECASTVLPLMLQAAFNTFGRRGVYWWPNVPVTDPSLDVLRQFLKASNMPSFEEREIAPRLPLNGDFSAAEQAWSSSHRKDIRRQRKRLAEQGPVSLWIPSSLEEAEAILPEFFRIHDEKWLEQGFPGMFHDTRIRLHFQAILRRLWGRGVHLSTVRCGETDISYHFGFFSGGWLQWYRPSYRREFHNFSPSKIHIAMLIEEGCRTGWNGFDFLLGEEPYKLLWTTETMEVISIHAGFHRLAPAYFWFSTGKPLARTHLQMTYLRMKAWLQNLRRRPS